jgi:hypothetical protein
MSSFHTIRVMRVGPPRDRLPAVEQPPKSAHYQIRVNGLLGEMLIGAFPGLQVHAEPGATVLTVHLPGRAALYGLLAELEGTSTTNEVLHEQVIIVAVNTVSVPRVADSDRANVDALGSADDGIVHVTADFGYMETPNVPHVLRLLDPSQTEGRIAFDGASYFLSSIELVVGAAPTMSRGASTCSSPRPMSPPTPSSISAYRRIAR